MASKRMSPGRIAVYAAIVVPLAGALPAAPVAMKLASGAFAAGAAMPAKYTCEGANVSPPLAWQGVPAGAKSLVLVVDDPDAPDPSAPKMTWVHWLLYDLPPTAASLAEGVAHASLPAGAREGTNDFRKAGYGGPCPPIGRHRYLFKLYALDAVLGDLHAPDKPALEAAMRGHVIGQAQLVGTYEKQRR